jgi:cellulose synthase/poly-beta-1,6-N-acetylglucosamine synthase-like glycosyltransferase
MSGAGQGSPRQGHSAAELVNVSRFSSFVELVRACRKLEGHAVVMALRQRRLPIPVRARRDVLLAALQHVFGQMLIARAQERLFALHPVFSAKGGLSGRQKGFLAAIVAFSSLGFIGAPKMAFSVTMLVLAMLFLTSTGVKLWAVIELPRARERPRARLHNEELPVYSVLLPLFRETRVLRQLIGAMRRLDYPQEKLDIKIILEEEDLKMRLAVAKMRLPAPFEVLVVPTGALQTKPRALNYALYFARGALITVFDAEDIPEPGQLRHAAEIFAAAPQKLACLQARLAFHDGNQNWLSRQFAIEYATLFDVILPVLGFHRWPLPLGGTSNHLRADVLRQIGAWDAYNVTEDADLGLRLARCGFEVDAFASTTFEEVNRFAQSWIKQRARWIKGWIQTALVHMRSPRRLHRELGFSRFTVTIFLLIGMVVSPLVHPFLLAVTLWTIAQGAIIPNRPDIVTAMAAGYGVVVFLTGYGVSFASQFKGMSERRLPRSWFSIATLPIYWLLISAAAWLAVWEFLRRPFHWHKTEHGLSQFVPKKLERAMGIEPTTSSLGSLRSTTELRPRDL